MKNFLSWLKNYKKEAFFAPFFKLVEAVFELIVPLIIADIIDAISSGTGREYIIKKGIHLVLLAFSGLAVSITAQFFAARAAVGVSGELRRSLFDRIMGMNASQIDMAGTSTLITRMTADISQVQTGINMTLRLLLRSPIIVFGAMIMAFTVDRQCALIFCIAVPVLAIIVIGITRFSIPMFSRVQSFLDRVMLLSRENLTGVRVIRAFNLQEDEIDKFRKNNEDLRRSQIFASDFTALTNPVTFIIVNIATAALIYKGAIRVNIGDISQGDAVAILNYMSQILVELLKLTNLIMIITKSIACADRVSKAMGNAGCEGAGCENAVCENAGCENAGCENVGCDGAGCKGAGMDIFDNANETAEPSPCFISFDHVSARYALSSHDALSDITFSVKKGSSVGIIGGTGCGKSTLVNLIPLVYPVSKGRLMVGGKDIRDIPVPVLRSVMGVVPQKSVLFKGTIRSNLTIGNKNATDEDMTDALKAAQCYEFVSEKGGLDALVLQGGKNFSGGQRQRLCIARALVRKPQILILDDSTSALDFLTEKKIKEEIAKLKGMTVFIVSQRASSVMACDQIIVLEDGMQAGRGTHEELLKNCPVYEEIYYSQFERKEAAV